MKAVQYLLIISLLVISSTSRAQEIEYVGSIDMPDTARAVYASGGFVYVATGASGLHIIDVSVPEFPVSLASYDTPGFTYDVFLSGQYVYLADKFDLRIVDISDPSNPFPVGVFGTLCGKVFVSGNLAYVIKGSQVKVIDVSDPEVPVLAGEYTIPIYLYGVPISSGIFVVDDYAYVTSNHYAPGLCDPSMNTYFEVIDFSEPSEPTLTGYDGYYRFYSTAIFISGEYAYIAGVNGGSMYGEDPGFIVVDISDPSEPSRSGRYVSQHNIYDISVTGYFACLAAKSDGIEIVDISYLPNPVLVSGYDTPGSALGISVDGEYIFVADTDSLIILRFARFTPVEESPGSRPRVFGITGIYPNPFNPTTTIEYNLSEQSYISIEVINILGQHVATLFQGQKPSGSNSIGWDASDYPSGVYFARLEAGERSENIKMVLLK